MTVRPPFPRASSGLRIATLLALAAAPLGLAACSPAQPDAAPSESASDTAAAAARAKEAAHQAELAKFYAGDAATTDDTAPDDTPQDQPQQDQPQHNSAPSAPDAGPPAPPPPGASQGGPPPPIGPVR